jgi:hypothetical protein
VALGLGLESKYAMLYFLAGALAAALVSGKARRFVFGWRGLAVVAIAVALISPNVAWNAQHGFPTIAHTEANADWGRARYSLMAATEFVVGQFGVFGPLLMVGLIGALWRLRREAERRDPMLLLAAFALPPLVLIFFQAFVARANANWAAVAFVAATPLAVAELARWGRGAALWVSFAVNGAAMLALWIFLVWPAAANVSGVGNAFKREEGWRELGERVVRDANTSHYDFIVADNRSIAAEVLFYARPRSTPVRVWAGDLRVRDHFEMTMRLEPGAARSLLVIEPDAEPRVLPTFDSAICPQRISIPVGGRHIRLIDLCAAKNYRGPQAGRARASVNPRAVL